MFNNGQTDQLNTMKEFGFQLFNNSRSFAAEMDPTWIHWAEKKAQPSILEAHWARKRTKLAAYEAILAQEGDTYDAGMF